MQEDKDTLLKEFKQFQEGGARLHLEEGKYTSHDEMLIIVNLHQKKGKEDSKSKFFYFKKEYRIQ